MRLRYKLCNQTVTVYHKDGDTVSKTVLRRAFFDHKKNQSVDKTGSREVNSFLLVVPTDTPIVYTGDKVIMGEGPDVTAAEWSGFIPAKVDGLAVVKYVDNKYYGTQMVHQEAGG